MKKRVFAIVLTLATVFALTTNAVLSDDEVTEQVAAVSVETEEAPAAAAEEQAEVAEEQEEVVSLDAAGTLSFANIGSRMKESFYPMFAIQERIDDIESHDYEWREDNLRLRIHDIANAQWMMISMDTMGTGIGSMMAQSYQSAYDAFRDEFDAVRDGTKQKDDENALWEFHDAQNQAIVAAESLYIMIQDYNAQDTSLQRSIAKLDRTVEEMELRNQLGQVSALDVQQVKLARVQAISGQQTLRTGIETMLLQMKSMVGAELGEPLTLGALPKVTQEQLAAMDLDKDLAQAMERSYSLFDARQQILDFRRGTLHDVTDQFGTNEKIFEVSQVQHALKAMEYNYDNTELTYELNFRSLYAQVKDAAQVLEAKRAALGSQEKSYAVSALKYEQGSISANALADAKDDLASAKDDVATAERDLFSKYHTYQWAVEYGILNS